MRYLLAPAIFEFLSFCKKMARSVKLKASINVDIAKGLSAFLSFDTPFIEIVLFEEPTWLVLEGFGIERGLIFTGGDAIFLLASCPTLGVLHGFILAHGVDAVIKPMHLPSALFSARLALLHRLVPFPLIRLFLFCGDAFSYDHEPLIMSSQLFVRK